MDVGRRERDENGMEDEEERGTSEKLVGEFYTCVLRKGPIVPVYCTRILCGGWVPDHSPHPIVQAN